MLTSFLDNNIDVLCIAETKLGETTMEGEVLIKGYKKPYRLDVSENRGGLLVYIKTDIPSKLLTGFNQPKDLQALTFEISLHNKKWLLVSIYNPNKILGKSFLNNLSDLLDFYSRRYDHCVILGDFNMQTSEMLLLDFLKDHNLEDIIKTNTCFKCKDGTAIDLILTNFKNSFQHTNVLETGLSDHHLMIYTMFKSTYYRAPPKLKTYRCFKEFKEESFLHDLYFKLGTNILSYDYSYFESDFTSTLNRYAPVKQKLIRGNDKPFVSNEMRKEIMLRSRLKGIANRSKLPEDFLRYKKQRNKVVALNKRNKKMFFSNLCINRGQKNFWEACKPILSSKPTYMVEKIHLEKNGLVVADDHKIAKILNENFINVVSELKLNTWKSTKLITNLADPVKMAFEKFSDHPSILKIKATYQKTKDFTFKHITPIEVLKQIKKLKAKKGVSGEIPIHVLQLSKEICASKLADCFNTALNNCIFPNELKLADVVPCFKKNDPMDPSNYRPISLLPAISKVFESIIYEQLCSFMKDKMSIFYVALDRVIAHNMLY